MKTLNIFFVSGVGYYAVSSEFEGAAFPIPEDVFKMLREVYEQDKEKGGQACVALFVQLREMESMPESLFGFLADPELAMTLSFEMDESVDAAITELLATTAKEVEAEAALNADTITLKVYRLSPYSEEALIVVSNEPEVGLPFSLEVIRMIGIDELSTEPGQQAFISTVEAARYMMETVDTADYVLDEEEVVYSITWKERSAVVH